MKYNKNLELFKSVNDNYDTLVPNTSNLRYERSSKFDIGGIKTIAYDRSKLLSFYKHFLY